MLIFTNITSFSGTLPTGGQTYDEYGTNVDNYVVYFQNTIEKELNPFIENLNTMLGYDIFDLSASDFNDISLVATEIANNNISKVVGAIENINKVVTSIDNQDISKIVGVIDDESISKVVGVIDSGNFDYFKTNYQTFVDSYDDFTPKYTIFTTNYDKFDTNYKLFTDAKLSFDGDLSTFNIAYKAFNDSITNFNTSKGEFDTSYNEVKPKLDTFTANYSIIENVINDSEYLAKVDSAKQLALIQDIKCGLSQCYCANSTFQQILLKL